MRELIERAIVRKAHGVLRKQRLLVHQQKEFSERYGARTGLVPGTSTLSNPVYWSFHPHFDPKYCIAHAKYLSRVIWRKLQINEYAPLPAVEFDIPKPDGTDRQVMGFSIPDSALSNVMHRSLTRRNINVFSSYSFAYRDDRGVFDAILHLKRSLGSHKSYVIQYDFSSYFDSIDHAFLLRLLFGRRLFFISDAESFAIQAFLKHRFARFSEYSLGQYKAKARGVPQGASISLFLANAAAHDLDLSLEGQSGIFTRFADDVVAITRSYGEALEVASKFREHCRDAGLSINYGKSPGIQLFVGGPDREARDFVIDTDDGAGIENITHIDYVGHRIIAAKKPGLPDITLPDKAVRRVKIRIARIIYIHLLQHRRGIYGNINSARIGPHFVDWDLITCINEIRKYLYGGLSESQVQSFLEGKSRIPSVRGLMGFLPLISKIDQLKELDGWVVSAIRRAQRERVRLVTAHGLNLTRLTENQLVSGSWYTFVGLEVDARLPSFVRAWRASRKFYRKYGLSRANSPTYYSAFSVY